MVIGIFIGKDKPEGVLVAKKWCRLLTTQGVKIAMDDDTKVLLSLTQALPLASCDILSVFGGDGTILRAARLMAKRGVPLLCFNLGRLGFLTELSTNESDLQRALTQILCGDYDIEERMMLKAHCVRNGKQQLALNDVVVARASYSHIIDIDVHVGGHALGRFVADGILLSSPTGSTGYSLSAGGPIVTPDVNCFVLSPICAHSLSIRPIVLGVQEVVEISVRDEAEMTMVTCDGQESFPLLSGDILRIVRAEEVARFVRMMPFEFFGLLHEKLSQWSR